MEETPQSSRAEHHSLYISVSLDKSENDRAITTDSKGAGLHAMWWSLSIILVFAAVTGIFLTEVLRSFVHAKRKSKDGLGGTQDIAMWGSLICIGLLIFAAVSVFLHLCT